MLGVSMHGSSTDLSVHLLGVKPSLKTYGDSYSLPVGIEGASMYGRALCVLYALSVSRPFLARRRCDHDR